jgi:hypothetical protein
VNINQIEICHINSTKFWDRTYLIKKY